MKKIVIAAIALVCALNANAQVGTVISRTIKTTTTTREVEIDFNKYNRISIHYASYKYNLGGADDILKNYMDYEFDGEGNAKDAWPGFIAEYIHGWRLMSSQPLFLESGLAFQFNIRNGYDYNYWHFGAAIPINVTYRYTAKNGFYVAPLVGLNLSSNAYDDLLWDMDEDSEKYIQLGYNVGANLGYKRLNIGIGYRGDFMPSLTTEDYGNIKTGTFHIGLGVNF